MSNTIGLTVKKWPKHKSRKSLDLSVGGDRMSNRLLSVDEVATFLGVKRDTVNKLIDRNGLPGVKVGRLWKFRQEKIDEWVNKQPGRQQVNGKSSPSRRGRRG